MTELSLTKTTCKKATSYIRTFDDEDKNKFIFNKEANNVVSYKMEVGYTKDDKIDILKGMLERFYSMGYRILKYYPRDNELTDCYKEIYKIDGR